MHISSVPYNKGLKWYFNSFAYKVSFFKKKNNTRTKKIVFQFQRYQNSKALGQLLTGHHAVAGRAKWWASAELSLSGDVLGPGENKSHQPQRESLNDLSIGGLLNSYFLYSMDSALFKTSSFTVGFASGLQGKHKHAAYLSLHFCDSVLVC